MRIRVSDALTLLFAVFIGMACGPDGIDRASGVKIVEGAPSESAAWAGSLGFVRPEPGQVIEDTPVRVRLELRRDSATVPSGGGPQGESPTAEEDFPPVRLVVNERIHGTLRGVSGPVDLEGLEPGIQVLRAFDVRDGGDSFERPAAFALTYFWIEDPADPGAFDANSEWRPQFVEAPVLTYNRPEGTLRGPEADSVMLDFHVARAELGPDAHSVRVAIDDLVTETLTRSGPHYIVGLPAGRHRIRLELLDPSGSQMRGAFTSAERTIVVEREGARGAAAGERRDDAAAYDRSGTRGPDESAADAPEVVPLDEEPACSDCKIRFTDPQVLGNLEDPASPGPTAEAVRLPDGSVAISSPSMGTTVLVYDETGRLLHTIGREGGVPVSSPRRHVSGWETTGRS